MAAKRRKISRCSRCREGSEEAGNKGSKTGTDELAAAKIYKKQGKTRVFYFHVHSISRRFPGQLLIPADSPEEEKAWPN
jgi:hypothetical protein